MTSLHVIRAIADTGLRSPHVNLATSEAEIDTTDVNYAIAGVVHAIAGVMNDITPCQSHVGGIRSCHRRNGE
jgi:hypothetical protein